MIEKEFTDVLNRPWWLLDLELKDERPLALRHELGKRWGWDDPDNRPINEQWFTKEDNLKLVYESIGETSDLMRELDAMLVKERGEGGSVDVYARGDWLQKVVDLKPKVAEKPADKGIEAPQGKVGEQPPVPSGTPAPPPQKEKVKLFGDKPAAAEASKPAPAADAPKQGLFDKAKAAKAAAPAQAAEAAAEAAAAPAAGAAAAGRAGEAATAPVPEAPPPKPSDQEILALADIPEAGLDRDELAELMKDPNFEADLAAAMANLEAELAASESEE